MAPNSMVDPLRLDVAERKSDEGNLEKCALNLIAENVLGDSDKFLLPESDCFAIILASVALRSLLKREPIGPVQTVSMHRTLRSGLELVSLKQKACSLEDTDSVQAVADADVLDALRLENMQLEEKIASAHFQVEELKKRRAEDARANEKVISIFATYEQEWKKERKKLTTEVEKLRHELQKSRKEIIRQRMQTTTAEMEGCEECLRKEWLIMNLKEKLGEQEFLILASMEEAKAEEQERKEMAEKLTVAEVMVDDLREKLAREVNERGLESQKHEAVLLDLRSNQRETEKERSQLVKEFESFKKERRVLLEEKKCADELIERLSIELSKLREDSDQKDMIISAMLWKENADFQERHDVESKFAVPTAKSKLFESRTSKCKRLIEETTYSSGGIEVYRPKNNFDNRAEHGIDYILEMQRLHDVEVKNLQSVFGLEVNMLRHKVRLYQDRVAELEQSTLLCMTNTKPMLMDGVEHSLRVSQSNEIITLDESVATNSSSRHIQVSAPKDLLAHYMDVDQRRDQEINKWKKLYFAAKATARILQKEKETSVCTRKHLQLQDQLELERAQFSLLLEQRHWQEIDAFERQMRAKDERMEAFRCQLLRLEKEAFHRLEKVESLTKELRLLEEENLKLQSLVREQEHEIAAYKQRIRNYSKYKTGMDSWEINKGEIYEFEALHKEIDSLKKIIREKELEHESTMRKMVEEAEAELQDKDFKLAVVEAKLVQAQLHEKERKIKENMSSDPLKKHLSPDYFARDSLVGELKVTNELDAVSPEVGQLLNRIAETQEKTLELEKQHQRPGKPYANIVMPVLDEKCHKDLSFKIEGDSAGVVEHKQRSELSRQDGEDNSCQKEDVVDKFIDGVEFDSSPSIKPSVSIRRVDRECSNLQKVMADFGEFNVAEEQISLKSCLESAPAGSSPPDLCLHFTCAFHAFQEECLRAPSFVVDPSQREDIEPAEDASHIEDADALSVVIKVKEIERFLVKLEKASKLELQEWVKSLDYVPCTMDGKGEAVEHVKPLYLKGTSIAKISVFKKQAMRYAVLAERANEIHKRVQSTKIDRADGRSSTFQIHEIESMISAAMTEAHQLQQHILDLGHNVLNSTFISSHQSGPTSQWIEKCLESIKLQLHDVHLNLELFIERMIASLETAL